MGNFYKNRQQNSASGNLVSQKRVRELKRQLEEAGSEKNTSSKAMVTNALLDSMKENSESIRTQRTQTKDASLQKKKVNYRHKSISSKIIRSKTSVAAKQVVSQAHREVQRLKREKAKGKYDSDEMDIAIEHAKSMERVARKKVHHLEQEEMAKATSKNPALFAVEGEDDTDKKTGEDEDENALDEEAFDESLQDIDVEDIASEETFETEMLQDDLTEELLEEMAENMADFLSEMGFEDLEDALFAPSGDMEPHEIKELEIKHRNKEMKDIVKADSEYLKAVFEHFQKEQGTVPSGGSESAVAGDGMSVGAVSTGTDFGGVAIDVSV